MHTHVIMNPRNSFRYVVVCAQEPSVQINSDPSFQLRPYCDQLPKSELVSASSLRNMKPFSATKYISFSTVKQMTPIEIVRPDDGVLCDGKIVHVGDGKMEVVMDQLNTHGEAAKSLTSNDEQNEHKEINIIGVLDPLKSVSEGWIAILSSKELLPGLNNVVKVQLYELQSTRLKTRQINILFREKVYIYSGNYSICNNGNGAQLVNPTNSLNTLKVQVQCTGVTEPSEFTNKIICTSIKTIGASNGNVILSSPNFRKMTSNPTMSTHSQPRFEQLRTLGFCINSLQTQIFQRAQAWLTKTFLSPSSPTLSAALRYKMLVNDTSKPSFKWISLNKGSRKHKNRDLTKKHSEKEHIGLFSDEKIRIEVEHRKRGCSNVFQFGELDVIKIKVVMFSLNENSFQLEVDLVQTFLCKSETDRFRRRITKVLKRNVITDFEWEKGITAAGNLFYVFWHLFQIPAIDQSLETQWDKFNITDLEHELRMRLFRDNDYSQTVASGCSFPFKITTDISKIDQSTQPHAN